ncbi:MAG: 6-phosphogluconolactonase [Crocinitomicaceae bacterium]|tara:strand:+ start:5317 stop:5979 length:663 start_codon:yes stop_codon:yes gene_type:complete
MRIFDNIEQLENEMCSTITALLTEAINTNGLARILLSGGSTPKGLYSKLSHTKIDWEKVEIGLVDERFVNTNSAFSNEKMIRQTLVINKAKDATFIGMVADPSDYQVNLNIANNRYKTFIASDVLILGMGLDGHTASIFPNDPSSSMAIEEPIAAIKNTHAPSAPIKRVTLNKAFINTCKHVLLIFSGTEKEKVYNYSIQEKYPISNFKEKIEMAYFAKN